jgi:hypothetical protein
VSHLTFQLAGKKETRKILHLTKFSMYVIPQISFIGRSLKHYIR